MIVAVCDMFMSVPHESWDIHAHDMSAWNRVAVQQSASNIIHEKLTYACAHVLLRAYTQERW